MFLIFFTKIWYGKTLSCRTSLKSGTAAAVPAVPAAPPMGEPCSQACIGTPQAPRIMMMMMMMMMMMIMMAEAYFVAMRTDCYERIFGAQKQDDSPTRRLNRL